MNFFVSYSAEHSGHTAQEQKTDTGSWQIQPKLRNDIQRVQADPHPITLGQKGLGKELKCQGLGFHFCRIGLVPPPIGSCEGKMWFWCFHLRVRKAVQDVGMQQHP